MKKNSYRRKLILLGLMQSMLLLNGCAKEQEYVPEKLINQVDINPNIEYSLDDKPVFLFDYDPGEQTYDYSEIEEIINNNPYLSDSEKGFIKDLKFVFDENHDYIMLDLIKERLASLKIVYHEGSNSGNDGNYDRNNNVINLYESTCFEDTRIDCLLHEFLHVLQAYSSIDFTMELSNEFFSRETLRRLYDEGKISNERLIDICVENYDLSVKIFGSGYNTYMPLYYTLAEVVDVDTLRKYQFGCNINTLCKGIVENGDESLDINDFYAFMDILNNQRVYDEKTHSFNPVETLNASASIGECYKHLDYYYMGKHGHSIKEDLNVSLLYFDRPNSSKYSDYSDEERHILDDLLFEYGVNQHGDEAQMVGLVTFAIPRTYLSDQHPTPYYIYNSPPWVTVELNEELNNEFHRRLKESQKSLMIK